MHKTVYAPDVVCRWLVVLSPSRLKLLRVVGVLSGNLIAFVTRSSAPITSKSVLTLSPACVVTWLSLYAFHFGRQHTLLINITLLTCVPVLAVPLRFCRIARYRNQDGIRTGVRGCAPRGERSFFFSSLYRFRHNLTLSILYHSIINNIDAPAHARMCSCPATL